MDAKIVKLGSLYFDHKPVNVGSAYNDKPLSIGDTVPGKEIQWIKDGNRLIADRCVCDEISWVQLNQMGLTKGAPIFVDGRAYLCRCPQTEPIFSEWYFLVDKYGDANELWHWNHTYFWSQNEEGEEATRESDVARCAVRGYYSAIHNGWFDRTAQLKGLGFRPVLEQMLTSLKISRALVGQKVQLYGPSGGPLTGTLERFDDYDLVLNCAPPLPTGCNWIGLSGGMVIVPRSAVLWIHKV